jgi:hypothetical protein
MTKAEIVALWREHLLIDIERFHTGEKMLSQRWTHAVHGRYEVISEGVYAIRRSIQLDLFYLGGMAGEW